MSGVFQRMLLDEYKAAFINRLENKFSIPDELRESIINYVKGNELVHDVRRLCAQDYFFLPPKQSMVRKGHPNLRRIVYSFNEKESYLLKYMTFVLMDFDYLHIPLLCSFRKENRTRMFFKKVRQIDPSRQLYIVKADMHDYYNSIDQDILISDVEPFFRDDPLFFDLVRWIMTRNEFYRHGQLIKESVSIAAGLPIGAFWSNMYLRDMDLELEPKAILYMRYSDDIAFFTDSYDKAQWALGRICEHTRRKKLEINEEKTVIYKPGEEAEILGFQILDGGFDIGNYSLKKLTDKLKRYCNKKIRRVSYKKCTCKQIMSDMVCFYKKIFFGKRYDDHELNWIVYAFPIITRTDGLKKIDKCAQDCIRMAGTCKKTNAKYRIKYEDIVKVGYKNLLHAYYHWYEIKNKIIEEQKVLIKKKWEEKKLAQLK